MATTLVMGQEKCSDLVLSSLVRARFGELIASKVDHGKSDLFLLGMLSLMDAILEVPMGGVVEGLAFDPGAKAELLGAKKGSQTPLTPHLSAPAGARGGEWEEATTLAKKLNLSHPFVNRAYIEAMAWARQMTSGVPAQERGRSGQCTLNPSRGGFGNLDRDPSVGLPRPKTYKFVESHPSRKERG